MRILQECYDRRRTQLEQNPDSHTTWTWNACRLISACLQRQHGRCIFTKVLCNMFDKVFIRNKHTCSTWLNRHKQALKERISCTVKLQSISNLSINCLKISLSIQSLLQSEDSASFELKYQTAKSNRGRNMSQRHVGRYHNNLSDTDIT